MKHALPYILPALIGLLLLPSCKKDNDNDFFIEATINGVKWKAKSSGENMALRSDNSQMKFFFDPSIPSNTTVSFFTNSSLNPFHWEDLAFKLQNGVIAPFDSKLRFNWETAYERNIDKFYIMQSISSPEIFQIVDSAMGAGPGNVNAVRHYSVTLPDVKTPYLNIVKYRIWVTLTGGASYYTNAFPVVVSPAKAQIVYTDASGKVYFPMDDDRNWISMTSYDPASGERRGTFSFKYKDESGNVIIVKDGKFHLKQ